ncbi:EAL domain-containing protein [Psychromonas aquimarina]|uniref:EAL domain-containing protein n=1 Tax=Psychromonas aquimarina TaxID=444919 RepID=UPI00040F28C8|nr:EAL domain-containing protein [Psychromonas aquimarina]
MKKAANITLCEFCSLNLEIERTAYYECLIQRLPDGNTAAEPLRNSDTVKQYAEDKQAEYCYSYKRLNGEVREYRIAQKLKEAAYEELFHLLYQPAVILDSNCFYGAKVLLGWSDSELGFVSHDEFIPIAEHLGVMPDIGQWIIKQSCLQLKEWNDAGTPLSGKLSINISIRQLNLKNFTHELLNNVLSEGALPIDIELDFTESFLLNDSKKVEEKFSELSMLGFGAAIDEFQTGYSTLVYLKTSSERTLKISRAYISSISTNPCDKKLVKAVIDNANRLGITTAAEGIETAEQAELVKELGCKLVQGRYYAEPCSADQFIQIMNCHGTI